MQEKFLHERNMQKRQNEKRPSSDVSRDILKHKEEIKIYICVKALQSNKLLLLSY